MSSGSVTFDSDIIGLIWTDGRLGSTHATLGRPALVYTPSSTPGLELGAGPSDDDFTISADRRTLSFNFAATTGQDQIRVITAVPEPSTVVLSLLGLAGLAAVRRRG